MASQAGSGLSCGRIALHAGVASRGLAHSSAGPVRLSILAHSSARNAPMSIAVKRDKAARLLRLACGFPCWRIALRAGVRLPMVAHRGVGGAHPVAGCNGSACCVALWRTVAGGRWRGVLLCARACGALRGGARRCGSARAGPARGRATGAIFVAPCEYCVFRV